MKKIDPLLPEFVYKDAYLYMAIGDDMRRRIKRREAHRDYVIAFGILAVAIVVYAVVWVVS